MKIVTQGRGIDRGHRHRSGCDLLVERKAVRNRPSEGQAVLAAAHTAGIRGNGELGKRIDDALNVHHRRILLCVVDPLLTGPERKT
jgi:hypothetical protein